VGRNSRCTGTGLLKVRTVSRVAFLRGRKPLTEGSWNRKACLSQYTITHESLGRMRYGHELVNEAPVVWPKTS